MDPAIIGGIIAAGGAATSAIINKAGTMHKGRRRLNRQKELAAYNQELQNAAYEKYQSPAAMMRQYKEAGLNPNLVYQNAAAGGPGVAQVDPSAVDEDDTENKAQTLAEVANSISTGLGRYYELKSQQIANSNAEIVGSLNGIRAQNEVKRGTAMDIANRFAEQKNQYQIDYLAAKSQSERFMLNYRQTIWMTQEKLKIDQQLENLTSTRRKRAKNEEEIINLRKQRDLMQEQINMLQTEQEDITRTFPLRANLMRGQAASAFGSARLSNSNAALNERSYEAGNLLDPFTGMPLWQLDAINRSGMLGYQARGQQLTNNKIASEVVGQNLRNMQTAYDYTTRYLKTFGDIVGLGSKAAVPFLGFGALKNGVSVGAKGSFKGSGLYDANGRYYAP